MEQRSAKEIRRINQIFEDLGLEKPPALSDKDIQIFIKENGQASPPKITKICPTTGKNQYSSESEAQRVSLGRRRHGVGYLRPYFCKDCKSYHLSSQAKTNPQPRT